MMLGNILLFPDVTLGSGKVCGCIIQSLLQMNSEALMSHRMRPTLLETTHVTYMSAEGILFAGIWLPLPRPRFQSPVCSIATTSLPEVSVICLVTLKSSLFT